ncbi:MAG: hypothetical protein ACO1RA_00505 [Planctomycetaceae bacterium]
MWRAFFLAMGISACVLGAECLVVDSFVLAEQPKTQQAQPNTNSFFGGNNGIPMARPKVMKPPEWAPWSLLSTGAIVILYSITMNRSNP